MSGHTPGPWVTHRSYGNHLPREVDRIESGREDEVICFMSLSESCDNEANARLIAAAPELYAALVDMVELAESVMRESGEFDVAAELADARAAIAKAEGK